MTLGAIHASGATPILVDIKDDFNMDEDLIESLIIEKTKGNHVNNKTFYRFKIHDFLKNLI